tara:strand:+ start:750 stop:1616 length:867 start_codon:yes stop_codon:yes gene_type:complete
MFLGLGNGVGIGGFIATLPETDFIWTVATTGAAETFTIPCKDAGVFNASVDWGDGSTSAITAYNDADLVHTYASAGDHQIRISGTFPNVYFANAGDKLKVKSVENLGAVGWVDLGYSFNGCANLTTFVGGDSDTSTVTLMNSMFSGCTGLLSADLSGMDISSTTRLNYAFFGCTNLASVIASGLDTSSVTSMYAMFYNCPSITDIVGVDDFNIEALTFNYGLSSFANATTLPSARYDALLIKWDAQNPLDGLSPDFGGSKYTAGGAAAAARANLISTDGWTITDGGTA